MQYKPENTRQAIIFLQGERRDIVGKNCFFCLETGIMQQDGIGFGLMKVLLKIWLTVIKVITSLLPTKRAIAKWLFFI